MPEKPSDPNGLPEIDPADLSRAMKRMVSTPKPPGGWGKKKPPAPDRGTGGEHGGKP